MSSLSAELRAGALPVGVVIPCRNAAPYLERHLKALEGWLHLAEEVVVVDSESTDGTVAVLRERLRHPRLRLLEHPPGLYPSWNFGIGRLTSTYAYIATVGDAIDAAGLRHLVEVAEAFASDVVVSPPRFVVPAGQPPGHEPWPVHDLLRELRVTAPAPLDARRAFLTTVLEAPSGILGSSASNLYRTAFLRAHPFPTEFGRCGDTAWALAHALDARWALTPRPVAEFLVHGPAVPEPAFAREAQGRLLDLARRTCLGRWPAVADLLAELGSTSARQREAGDRLKAVRARTPLWVLRPEAWRARRLRNRLREDAARLRAALEALRRADAPA